jgi:hypothetical protein
MKLCRRTGEPGRAERVRASAIAMLREIDMRQWMADAGADVAKVSS